MSQSRKASLLEACANMATGMVVSYIVGLIIFPLLGWPVSHGTNAIAVSIFTVTSLIRSYLWRRAFNWWQHRKEA